MIENEISGMDGPHKLCRTMRREECGGGDHSSAHLEDNDKLT
jgi:hypothetical protein